MHISVKFCPKDPNYTKWAKTVIARHPTNDEPLSSQIMTKYFDAYMRQQIPLKWSVSHM